MMSFVLNGIFIIVICLISGCQRQSIGNRIQELRGDEFVKYIEGSNHILNFRYIPDELNLLLQSRLDTNKQFTQQLLDSLKSNVTANSAIRFSFELNPINLENGQGFENDVVYGNFSGESSYQKTLNKYLFGLNENIWLEVGGRRIDLLNYHMVRSWGLTRGRTFMLLFPDIIKDNSTEFDLVIENIVPGQGRNKIRWKYNT